MLHKTFLNLLAPYTDQDEEKASLWSEIKQHYTRKNRHYHGLSHLENLLAHLQEVKDQINNWESTLFSLFYHDIIYNPMQAHNEEKSAALAEKRMQSLGVNKESIALSKAQILATKTHFYSLYTDVNYFTDADLAILGSDWANYENYSQKVRKEYALTPIVIYRPARKKVLRHFLAMNKIYKTSYFYNKYEAQARLNIQRELDQ